MSKFTKPQPKAIQTPTRADIERVIDGASTDGSGAADGEIRFTLTLPKGMADQVDRARKTAALTRLAWIRLAVSEKLAREV